MNTPPTFIDPVTLRTLPPEQFPERYFRDQTAYFDGATMWNRASAGLLRWMQTRVDQAKERGAKPEAIENAQQFLEFVAREAGIEIGKDAVEPVKRGNLLPFYERF